MPGVVGSDVPEVAFEVAACEGSSAVVHVADVEDHLCSGCFSGGVDGVGVVDDKVETVGFAHANLVGLDRELAVFAAVVDGAKHDHAIAEGELGMPDGVIGTHVDGVLGEAEGADEPVDGGESIAIAEAGDYGGGAGFRLIAHG